MSYCWLDMRDHGVYYEENGQVWVLSDIDNKPRISAWYLSINDLDFDVTRYATIEDLLDNCPDLTPAFASVIARELI